jgi:hypothetical protein
VSQGTANCPSDASFNQDQDTTGENTIGHSYKGGLVDDENKNV